MKRYISPLVALTLFLCALVLASLPARTALPSLSEEVETVSQLSEPAGSSQAPPAPRGRSEESFQPDIDYNKEYIIFDPLLPVGDGPQELEDPPVPLSKEGVPPLPVTGSNRLVIVGLWYLAAMTLVVGGALSVRGETPLEQQ